MRLDEYLEGALGRLRDDVGSYIEWLKVRNKRNYRKVGFFGLIRLLMPVVESTAKVYKLSPAQFMSDRLNVPAAHVMWQMYRNPLIHGDSPDYVEYKGRRVGWGISFIGKKHRVQKGHVGIDPFYLYKQLETFLNNAISEAEDRVVNITVGMEFITPTGGVEKELEKYCERGGG